jgi:hypothetical protein
MCRSVAAIAAVVGNGVGRYGVLLLAVVLLVVVVVVLLVVGCGRGAGFDVVLAGVASVSVITMAGCAGNGFVCL